MVKLIDILREDEEQKPKKILVPRRIDQRHEKRIQMDLLKIQKYIDDGCEGTLDLNHSTITELPDNLTKAEGNVWLDYTKIKNLNNLRYVGGNLELCYCPITELPDNLEIDGYLNIVNSKISSIPNNLFINGGIYITGTPLLINYIKKTTFSYERIRSIVRKEIEDKGGYLKGYVHVHVT